MPLLTTAALRKQIASGDTGPLYLLVGADDVEKSAVAGEFAAMVEEDLQAFNVERFHGSDVTVDALMDAARTLPMMAPRRVIVVMDAEKLLTPKRENKAVEQDQERLEAFLKDPPPHATIVFVSAALDMRRRIPKLLHKDAPVVDCGTITSDADAEQWVKVRAARDGVKLDPAAARALVALAGLDLVRLRSGLERVALYAMDAPSITVEDVKAAVPAGPEAQADWGIANAIGRGDAREALKELGLALDAGTSPFFVLGQIRVAAEKMPAPHLAGGIDAMMRTDLALKSSGGDPRILLERLVVELSAGRGRSTGRAARPPYRR